MDKITTKVYDISLRVEVNTGSNYIHPSEWDWRTILDLRENESVKVNLVIEHDPEDESDDSF